MNTAILKADTRESTTVTLRFDPRMLARIKRLARSRYLNYQSMIKQWLSERLEKENLKRLRPHHGREERPAPPQHTRWYVEPESPAACARCWPFTPRRAFA